MTITKKAAIFMALGISFYFYWFYYMGSKHPGTLPDWVGHLFPTIGIIFLFLSWRERKRKPKEG